ncbi:protein TIFY 5A-like [Salvia divinorum]|uniref:Protein TIFY n=1 Tax=Salvia divinorum TaxID=28513 RepID=A0ABD1II93_SALDI
MKRNYNLGLRLERPSLFLHPADHQARHPEMVNKDGGEKQQLTIFYNGKIAVCDATELQARAIIWLAGREVEPYDTPQSDLPSPFLASPLYSPNTGLKRSLMRFLQTRKTRVQATSPYPITRNSNQLHLMIN